VAVTTPAASLAALTRPELISCPLGAGDREEVLRTFARQLAAAGAPGGAEELYAKLAEREELGSTGIGAGVAIPHCKVEGLARPMLAVGVARSPGVDFAAVDDEPVRVFFALISPAESPAEHLRVLAALSRWLKGKEHREGLLAAKSPEAIYQLLAAEPL
jgi:PTS system nitrogen regulatory IIA component